jgi:Mrp family chromosome partitioning ATPase
MPKNDESGVMKDSFDHGADDTFSKESDDARHAEAAGPGLRHSFRPRSFQNPRPVRSYAEVKAAKAAPAAGDAFVINRADRFSHDELPASGLAPYVARPLEPAAPAAWQELPHLAPVGADAAHGVPLVDLFRDDPGGRAFDLLRTRLRHTTHENNWVNIAVTAPTPGCGNTFTAVNIALSLSRVPQSRTVLMDFNMRAPGVASALGLETQAVMHDYLTGTIAMKEHMVRLSDTLALGLSDASSGDAAEILQHPQTPGVLQRMRDALRPEIVLYDMPPMLTHDDVSAFLPHLDGVLLVSDGTQTTASQLIECERMLDSQVPLLGVVLNRARASSVRRYS